jgi:hypothetical protein
MWTVPDPVTTCGRPPVSSRATPVTIISTTEPANRYVGSAKIRPASRRPRRLARHMTPIAVTEMTSRILGPMNGIADSAGNADTIAALPAAVCTATVTT